MIDFIYQLTIAMKEANLFISGNINQNTNKIQRFKSTKNMNGGLDIFVIVHFEKGASFGDWRDRDSWVTWWKDKEFKLDKAQQYEYILKREEFEREKLRRQKIAVSRANNFWVNTPSDELVYNHPYIVKKQINPYYAKAIEKKRWIKGVLLLPMRDVDYQLKGVQIIKSNGFKRPWKGTTYKNNMIWICCPLPEDYKDIIRVCEGYATACSIYKVTGDPVVCALNSYNLINVVNLLRKKYVHALIRICADNDTWGKENVGIKCAKEAMITSNATISFPEFSANLSHLKLTDFNDLLIHEGEEITRNQLILIRDCL